MIALLILLGFYFLIWIISDQHGEVFNCVFGIVSAICLVSMFFNLLK